jgi:menaquinone-specific isochorismate synthase
MRTAIAFLQTGVDALACVAAPLDPVASPSAGSPAFFAPPFSMTPGHPWWFSVPADALRVHSRAEWATRFAEEGAPVWPSWRPPDEGRFAEAFRSLTARLADGRLRKGVPVTVMRAEVDPAEAERLFSQLLARVPGLPPNLQAYGFFRPASDTGSGAPEFLIGATPEILFEIEDGRRLSTVAVAGTRRAGSTAGPLNASLKDRDEHQSVVDDLMTQLSAWGQPHASATEVRVFGSLEHLAVDLAVDSAAPLDFEAVARRLHPTPALGVYPRNDVGAAWLAGLDADGGRRRFGAPFGLRWPPGSGRAVVAIRSLQYQLGRLEIWAGCGVVAQSRYDDEWQEVLDKMQAVRTLWGV